MKHIKLYEEFVTEKAYRMTGNYAAKGIIGKVMQSFKKEIERVKYEGDEAATLEEVNDAWKDFSKDAQKIILDEVKKAVKDMEQVVYVHVTGLNKEWEADTINGLNREGGDLFITIPGDFVINVGFMDDVDGSKHSRKLGGMMNSPIFGGEDIHGKADENVGDNNAEIRGVEFISIDAK
jgi:hypothetical protein